MSITGKRLDVEEEVLKTIKPSREEYVLIERVYSRIKNALERVLKENNVEAEVSLQGSIAKDTWLSGEYDLDIFVLFPEEWSREEIDNYGFKLLLQTAKEIGKYTIRYAEHPYVRVYIEGVEADLVPAIKVSDPRKAKTAVDRTPFHTRYVIEHLDQAGRDDVRLLKKFMKTVGVYGAEIRVKGFSGYMVELLVITYGSFHNVLRNAVKWKPPVYINTLNMPYREFREVIGFLRRKYPDSIVYAPDPVDPSRNAGAAVSSRSLALFSIASRCYLENPSKDFFYRTRLDYSFNELISQAIGRCIFFLILPLLTKLPPETLWGELDRIADRLWKLLKLFDFKPVYYSLWSNEDYLAIIGFELEECILPIYKCREGPPHYVFDRVHSFIEKHYSSSISGPWVGRDGLLKVLTSRKYRFIQDILIDRFKEYLVPPHFRNIKPVIVSIEGLYRVYEQEEAFREWIADFVLRKPVWMKYCIV